MPLQVDVKQYTRNDQIVQNSGVPHHDAIEAIVDAAAGVLDATERLSTIEVIAEGVGAGFSGAGCVAATRVKYDVCHMPLSYQLVDSEAATVMVTAGTVTYNVFIAPGSGKAVTVIVCVTVCIEPVGLDPLLPSTFTTEYDGVARFPKKFWNGRAHVCVTTAASRRRVLEATMVKVLMRAN